MKKLTALILLAAVLFTAAASAEDRDPVVGYWYMLYDSRATPEFKTTFPGVWTEISVYDFREDGTIFLLDNTVAEDGTSSQAYSACGKWSRTDSGYTYSIIATGEGEMIVQDDEIYLQVSVSPTYYIRIKKMLIWNPYVDMTTTVN